MIHTLTAADIDNAVFMRDRLRALDPDLLSEVRDLFKMEVCVIDNVARGEVKQLSDDNYAYLVFGAIEVEMYLQSRSVHVAWQQAHKEVLV